MSDALALKGLIRTYGSGENALPILKGVDFALAKGEAVALLGPSGSGKSTLLHSAGLLERPDGGSVHVDGVAGQDLDDAARARLRLAKIGFVYQFHHLLPELTALENAAMPLRIAGRGLREAIDRARELLERLGVAARAEHRPAALSGGERQRVAIARALVHGPALLLADEPTGNLDGKTSDAVGALLLETARGQGAGVLVATHDPAFAAKMDRAVRLKDGVLVPA